MDVEKILARAAENLSVRRAFGTAYEKDGMLIIPVALVAGGAAEARAPHLSATVTQPPVPIVRPSRPPRRTTRRRWIQGAPARAGASAGWCCRRAPTS